MENEYVQEHMIEDVSHLPLVQRMTHKEMVNKEKAWSDCATLLQSLPEDDPQFREYWPLVKKTLKEKSPKSIMWASNCLAPIVNRCQLDVAEYGYLADLICSSLLNHTNKTIVAQCRDALFICIEVEQYDIIVDAAVKAAGGSKVPKVHEANLAFLVQALKEYGPAVINLRKVKPILGLVTSANGNVRNECRNLIMEMYRWAKDDLKPLLKDLPEKNLPKESEFEALKDEKPEPVKFTKKIMLERERLVNEGADIAEVMAAASAVESLVDPIDIFKKVPGLLKDLQNKQELKNVLPVLVSTLENNRALIPSLNYDELFKLLIHIAVAEARFMLSVDACKSLTLLATRVKDCAAPHASKAIPELLRRTGFRQKALIDAVTKTLDVYVPLVKFEKFLDLVTEFLEDKKPDIVYEAGELIARSVANCPANEVPKKLPAQLVSSLSKAFACSKVEARDAAMKATGALLKLTNDRALQVQVDKLDNPKKAKIKDFMDKCVVVGSSGGSIAPAAKSVPKKITPAVTPPVEEVVTSAPAKKPASSSAKTLTKAKPAGKAVSSSGGARKGKAGASAGAAGKGSTFNENVLSDEDIICQVEVVCGESERNMLSDSNWKNRVSAVEKIKSNVSALENSTIPVQALTRVLSKKPGLKDNNFQVLRLKIEVLEDIFTRGRVSLHTVDACKVDLTEKLADAKNAQVAVTALLALAEAVGLEALAPMILEAAFSQKNPKVQSEALNWTAQAITEFGFKVPAKTVIETVKVGLSSANPAVRTSAVKLFGVMYIYLKRTLRGFFENEKPTVVALLDAEIERVANQVPPTPVRGLKASDSTADNDGSGDGACRSSSPEEMVDAADLLPRTDISGKLQGDLIARMCDSNWKTRAEAYNEVEAIIREAKLITPNLGELPKVLKARIADTNKIIASNYLELCQRLIEAMGPQGSKHSSILLPAVMGALADSKALLRSAAIKCLNKWYEVCKDSMNMFLEGDKIAEALKTDNPYLKASLLDWFAEKLDTYTGKQLNKELLSTCIGPIYNCLGDRSGEVRKSAQNMLLPIGKYVGYNVMLSRCNALPPSTKSAVAKHLETIRAELQKSAAPATPAPAAVKKIPSKEQPSAGKKEETEKKAGYATFTRKFSSLSKTSSSQADIEEEDPPPKKDDGKARKKNDDEMSAATLFASRDLKAVVNRKDNIRWFIHDTKTLEKDKLYLLQELRRLFEVAQASKECIKLTFSELLPHHVKIVDAWIEALKDPETQDMILSNRDLIIRWGAVHCYDKNWMTINYFMKFLLELLPVMNELGLSLEPIEICILLPNFLSKFVSMTSQSQELVDNVMKTLPLVVKPQQIFVAVTDMLKSQKNFKLAKNMIDEMLKLIDEHGEEIRRLPLGQLKLVVKSLTQFTSQSNMKEATYKAIAEVCFLKDSSAKDQRDLLRDVSDKDRPNVEKYITKLRETRPPPSSASREVASAGPPAFGIPSSNQIGSNGSGIATPRGLAPKGPSESRINARGIGRGIPSPRSFGSRSNLNYQSTPNAYQQTAAHQIDLNAVNNNNQSFGGQQLQYGDQDVPQYYPPNNTNTETVSGGQQNLTYCRHGRGSDSDSGGQQNLTYCRHSTGSDSDFGGQQNLTYDAHSQHHHQHHQQASFADPRGTFVRSPGSNMKLMFGRTIQRPTIAYEPPDFDSEGFEKMKRKAMMVLKKEELTRVDAEPFIGPGPSERFNPEVNEVNNGSLITDEHFIAKKLNCTSIEDVISGAQQIQMSLSSAEMDMSMGEMHPEINEQYVNSLFIHVGRQWETVLTLYIPDDTCKEESIRLVVRTLGNCVFILINTSFAKLASQEALEKLLPPAFALMSHEYLAKFIKPGGSSSDVQKLLNDIIVKSLDKCNSTRVTCAILRIYSQQVATKHFTNDANSRACLELMTKCLWKLVRHWKQKLPEDLQVYPVLATADECLHIFSQASCVLDLDKEHRTVKSVVTELYNHYERRVMDELEHNFSADSEVHKCVTKHRRNKMKHHARQEKDRPRLRTLVEKLRATNNIEELVIHILVEDISQEELCRHLSSPEHVEMIRSIYRELPNIREEIQTKGFPENFGYLSSEAVSEIMRYLERIWDMPGMTPLNMAQVLDEARNRPCPDIQQELDRHSEFFNQLLAEFDIDAQCDKVGETVDQ